MRAGQIFVGGTGRSGTTWLAAMIGEHPDVWSVPVESRFLVDVGGFEDVARDLTELYTPLRAEATMDQLRDMLAMLRRKCQGRLMDEQVAPAWYDLSEFDAWASRLQTDLEAFKVAGRSVGRYFSCRAELASLLRSYVDELFGVAALARDATTWCEKTPYNFLSADFLWELFPQARMAHIYRHPVQVAASHLRQGWVPDTIEEVCDWLDPIYRRWLELAPSVESDPRYIGVALEDLCRDWPRSRSALFARLDLTDAEVGAPDVQRLVHPEPLSARDEAYVRDRLGYAIDVMGYATSSSDRSSFS